MDDIITYSLLESYKTIAHFCTTRHGGVSMGSFASNNLSTYSGDDPDNVAENRARLTNWLGISPDRLVTPYQTHETNIKEIDDSFFCLNAEDQNAFLQGVDALFTRNKGVCIGISTADCVPLMFYDRTKEVVAVAHAGWRGTCAGIATKTLQALSERYNSDPSDVLVTIGPSISVDVYRVGEEVVLAFEKEGFCVDEITVRKEDEIFIDLWKANQILLEKNGVPSSNIQLAGICTYTHHNRFFSARRLGIRSGRLLSGIMIKNS